MEFTDLWAAEEFAKDNEWKCRWVPEWKSWILWDGDKGVWIEDKSCGIFGLVGNWVRTWTGKKRKVVVPEDDIWNEKLGKWLISSENLYKIEAIARLAKGKMVTRVDGLDSHLWKLNLKNCVVDLLTGLPEKHSPEFLMTKTSPVNYIKNSTIEELCPNYIKFLNEVMCGREDATLYMQKIMGSCMVGQILDRAFYIWAGKGKNGKTTLANTWMNCLGRQYAVKMPFAAFTKSRFDDGKGVTPDLHHLKGARLAVASEGEENQQLSMSKLKEMTGKSMLSVNPKNKDQYDFLPEATIVLDTNEIPSFNSTDMAIMDRLIVVPFDYRIEKGNVRRDLDEVLKQELDGIFMWGLRGCERWQKEGMDGLPKCVVVAIELQRQENDPVGIYLGSGIFEEDEDSVLNTKEIFDPFIIFADENGLPKMGISNFKKRMKIDRFIGNTKIERLDKIFGIRGGGYRGLRFVESELRDLMKNAKNKDGTRIANYKDDEGESKHKEEIKAKQQELDLYNDEDQKDIDEEFM
jgi:putative DNA primase/helicase